MRSPRYVVHKLVHMCYVIFHSLGRRPATRPENVSLARYQCAAPVRDPLKPSRHRCLRSRFPPSVGTPRLSEHRARRLPASSPGPSEAKGLAGAAGFIGQDPVDVGLGGVVCTPQEER